MWIAFLLTAVQTAPPIEVSHVYRDLFGVCIDSVDDLDGDGVRDLWVGDPTMRVQSDTTGGSAWAISGKTGKRLRQIESPAGAHGFGWTLASVADVDGDKIPEVVVGCEFVTDVAEGKPPGDKGGNLSASRSKVFLFGGKEGLMRFSIEGPSENAKADWYSAIAGPALVAAGDWNGDGAGDFAVGWAFADKDGVVDCGRVEVISGKNGAILKSWSGVGVHDRLGCSLVLLDDLDGDGHKDLAAGAVPDSYAEHVETYPKPPRTRSSYVLVLLSKGGPCRTLKPTDGSSQFGLSLGALPDVNHDGVADLAIGQPFYSVYPDPAKQAITIWSMKEGSQLRRIELPANDDWDGGWGRKNSMATRIDESFGTRLFAVPDRDGDGVADIVATVPQAFCFVPAGVLSSATGRPLAHIELAGSPFEYSHVGVASCRLSDVDGDGTEDFAIGGASVRCGSCDGCVVFVSGKTFKPIRFVGRRDMVGAPK